MPAILRQTIAPPHRKKKTLQKKTPLSGDRSAVAHGVGCQVAVPVACDRGCDAATRSIKVPESVGRGPSRQELPDLGRIVFGTFLQLVGVFVLQDLPVAI